MEKSKLFIKRLFIVVFILALVVFLPACDYIEENDAKPFVEEYLTLLEEENYDEIILRSYFYENNIVAGFEKLESETNLDFQAGINIIEYTAFESRYSDSYYGMPICEMTMKVEIGGNNALMEVNVVDNDGTYNVCDIYITINDEPFGIS